MADAPEKVSRGDPFIISADTHNAFVDAAVDHQQRAMSGKADPLPHVRGGNLILVRNDSGENRRRFEILGIDVPVILPDENLAEFSNRVAMSAIVPTSDGHWRNFVVLNEPIRDGGFGQGWLSGVTPVQIDIVDVGHTEADVKHEEPAHLESGANGAAQILWKEQGTGGEPDTGVKWAVVRLGGAAALTAFGVVREAEFGSVHLRVSPVKHDDADPWVGGYEFAKDDEDNDITFDAITWPGLHGEDYGPAVWPPDAAFHAETHVLPLMRIGNVWHVMQKMRFSFPPFVRDPVLEWPISDCNVVRPSP